MKLMQNKKGFTLAELLIVVAIIAVLVSISIPIFTTQLEKSREATDLANVRSAYVEVMVAYMSQDKEAVYTIDSTQTISKKDGAEYSIVVPLKQKKSGWTTKLPLTIGNVKSASSNEGDNGVDWIHVPNENGTCLVKYLTEENQVIIDWQGVNTHPLQDKHYSTDDFGGPVPATWKGAGGGAKNNMKDSAWYNQSLSTQKLVELDSNSEYLLTYTIPSDYKGNTIQMGTLLFKDDAAIQNIKGDALGLQKADSDWISSNMNDASNPKYNYQVVTTNADGSKTITQKINTDQNHVYFGANFWTGNNLTNNPSEKDGVMNAINSIKIEKIK